MQSAPIDLLQVRQIFKQPSLGADFIYREIAARMLERLHLVRLDPTLVLDAGCGHGADVQMLQSNYPTAHVVGLDISEASLQTALRERAATKAILYKLLPSWLFSSAKNSNSQFISADFSSVPMKDQSVELIWSTMALHWHPEPDLVFQEWRRLLKTNGLLMFSCFGPDSLKEIRQAFDGVESNNNPHTLPFVDMHDFGDMLVNAGFATPVMDMEVITLTYSTVPQLLKDVRALGGNPLQTRRKGLLGKAAWQKMCGNLERMRREDGRIPLTLEIIYGHAFKPIPKRANSGESIIQFDYLNKKNRKI